LLQDFLINHQGQPDGPPAVNNLLKNSQHGFMPKKSCTTNIQEFLEKTTSIVDTGEAVEIVFKDFAKAFDKVPWKRLLVKLKLKWLSRRQQ
jgi:hypothetical protein